MAQILDRDMIKVLDQACLGWPTGPYEIIYADPPWSYKGREQFRFKGDVGVGSGGAVNHYETMRLEEICALPVESICSKDALLFMWATSPLLPEAFEVITAWGFLYATVAFVWNKLRTNPGYYTMSQVELCLVAKKGTIPQPRGSRNERQWLDTEVVAELRGEHSTKPTQIRDKISAMFPEQRKVELFARQRAAGWDGWGKEYPR